MAISLRESGIKTLSQEKMELKSIKQTVVTISNEIVAHWVEFDNKIDQFMKDWRAYLGAKCAYSNSGRICRYTSTIENCTPVQQSNLIQIKERVEAYDSNTNLEMRKSFRDIGFNWREKYASITNAFILLPQYTIDDIEEEYSDFNENSGCRNPRYNGGSQGEFRYISIYSQKIQDFKNKRSDIAKLMEDFIDYLDKKITTATSKITELK